MSYLSASDKESQMLLTIYHMGLGYEDLRVMRRKAISDGAAWDLVKRAHEMWGPVYEPSYKGAAPRRRRPHEAA